MAGYFTIEFQQANAPQDFPADLVSHDGYKKKVTVTFQVLSGSATISNPTAPVKVSLDEDETEAVVATLNGNSTTGTLRVSATDGTMTDADEIQYTFS